MSDLSPQCATKQTFADHSEFMGAHPRSGLAGASDHLKPRAGTGDGEAADTLAAYRDSASEDR